MPVSAIRAASLALTFAAASAFAPQSLVLQKEGTTLYHRPWCPVVRDAKDVLAMSRGQADGRGLKPHADCDRDPPSAGDPPAPGDVPPSASVIVYVAAAKPTHYHREGCKRLGRDPKKLTLAEAGRQYWPCTICKPPIRKRKS